MSPIRQTVRKAVYRITLYHGTPVENLAGIMSKGLQPRGAVGWSSPGDLDYRNKSIFLTAEIEKAARYGTGPHEEKTPCILEVVISGQRRVHLLKYDQMDRSSNAWQDDGDFEREEDEIFENINQLAQDVIKALTKQEVNRWFEAVDPLDNIEDLDGKNLFKLLVKPILQQTDSQWIDRRAVIKAIKNELKKPYWEWEIHGYMEVRPNGTLKLTDEYFSTREQLYFQKGLPPSTIKDIWLREYDWRLQGINHASILEQDRFGSLKLPGEIRQNYDQALDSVGDFHLLSTEEMATDYRSIANLVDVSDFLEQIGRGPSEVLLQFHTATPDERPDMIEDLLEELEVIEDELLGFHGEDMSGKEALWFKLSPREAFSISRRRWPHKH